MKVFSLFCFLLSSSLLAVVNADWGDTVDPTFNCPALTTCVQVCVPTVEDCPPEMACPNSNEKLCKDGSCAADCADGLETPCAFQCAPVACHKIDDTHDQCQEKYRSLYDAEKSCGEIETALDATLLTYGDPAYLFALLWIPVITFLIVAWCAYNQRFSPVPGSTKVLQVDAKVTNSNSNTYCTQTGYKTNPIGIFLFVCTVLTFWGFSAVLFFLTIQYYRLELQKQASKRTLHFEDEHQVLKAFIIVWMTGLVWCFSLHWPSSMSSLFLRRCSLKEATHVAVFLQDTDEIRRKNQTEKKIVGDSWLAQTRRCLESFFVCLDITMAFIFSDLDSHLRTEGTYKFCKVTRDKDGNKSFIFLLRRYNLSISNEYDIDGAIGTFGSADDEDPYRKPPPAAEQVFWPGSWSVAETLGDIFAKGETEVGLTSQQVKQRYRIVGQNIIEMDEPTFFKCLAEEFMKPFYTYQLYVIWSWMPLYYFYMGFVIGLTVFISAVTVATFHYRNLANLYKITHVFGGTLVLRDGAWDMVDHTYLVPGDIVKIAPGVTYSDMVLLKGENTLMDESALTGEATPQVKMPVDPTDGSTIYRPEIHKRHTISAGTTVLEAEDAIAVVMKTASYTVKGELLREIFGFRRHTFKFDQEIYVVMVILVIYAITGYILVQVFLHDTAVVEFFYGVYVVATAIPPLLPTTFTVSVGVSDVRLQNKRIACSNSESILVAGKVKIAFFDKTGTLTKQGLDFQSGRSAENWNSTSVSPDLYTAMSCCHSIAHSKGGDLIGTPVDRTMFLASGAQIVDDEGAATSVVDNGGNKLTIVRHFDFDHHRMTQSVIVKLSNGTFVAYVKGSGESISKLCIPESLPSDFQVSLRQSAAGGIYQISVASKPMDEASVHTITRDELEKDCSFIGVLNFLNAIREETVDVIRELSEGSVKSIVVTGDHTLTGIQIAREAGILRGNTPTIVGTTEDGSDEIVWTKESGVVVDMPTSDQLYSREVELALSGSAWRALREKDTKHANDIAQYVGVFGRCTPFDKVSVVDTFVEHGFITLMCGDGGNDCGALKAAHVGVALSDAEASIVAPFTSLDRTITSVADVLLEGRCALASAFAVYKYIVMYGQITCMNQIMNAYFAITFAEWNWVFIDGIWPIILAYTLPLARAANKLPKTRPTASILGLQTVSSVVGMIFIHFVFTLIALSTLFRQDWFQCRKWVPGALNNVLVIGDNYEAETIFLVTGAQYLSTAMALNFGYEFRQMWFRNYWFVFFVAFFFIIQVYITLKESKLSCFWRVNCENDYVVIGVTGGETIPIQNPFNTTVMPNSFQKFLIGVIFADTVAVLLFEYFVVNGTRRRSAAKKLALAEVQKIPFEQSDRPYETVRPDLPVPV